MTHRHAHPLPPRAPEDRSWAARAEALKREKPAQLAIVFALLAFLTMLAGWVAVLIAPGGGIRGNPVFWLLAAPLMLWLWNVQSLAVWTVKTMWLVLVLAPCLALLALVVAPTMRQTALLEGGRAGLDTPLAMSVILGLTTTLAGAGLIALRRSSLPGGTRPVAYVAPGTPVPGARTLAPAATNMLMLGSLPFSGTLINGVFFAIVATMEPVGPGGEVWPTALVAALVLTVATLVFRGGFRLARQRPGAAADLRRGWRLGIGCTIAAVAALWAWPTIIAVKLGFSCFVVPIAIATAWSGRRALRDDTFYLEMRHLPCPSVSDPVNSGGSSPCPASSPSVMPACPLRHYGRRSPRVRVMTGTAMPLSRLPRRRDVLACSVVALAAASAARAQARRGGVLRVSVEQAPAKLNPLQHRVGAEYLLGELLYSGLTRLGPDMAAEPDLAVSWAANPGLTEWTFKLRPGVVFHDGSLMTARDVAATFAAILDPATGSPARSNIGPVERVTAPDDMTVLVMLKGAYADLPVALAYTNAKILPAATLAQSPARFDREAIGTGPFRLVSYEPSRLTVVERNPSYYDPARPLLDRIEVALYPDAAARTSALLGGATDLLLFGQPTDFERMSGAKGVRALRTASGQFLDVVLGCNQKPFDDVRVRRALSLTLDRDALVELVAEGLGSPGVDTPSNASAYRFDRAFPPKLPDIAEAKRLLAEAGHPRGLAATLVASDRPGTRTQLGVAIREMAKPAGFTINVQTMAHATFLDQVWLKGPFYVGLYNQQPSLDGILSFLFTSDAAWNEAKWNNKQFDALVGEARQTADEVRRRELYAQAQQLMHDEVPVLVPVFFDLLAGIRDGVEGFRLHPRGAVFRLDEVWLSRAA